MDTRTAESWHGTLNGYSRHRCRCDACVAVWNGRYRARVRAVQRLINAHRSEFEQYQAEEVARL